MLAFSPAYFDEILNTNRHLITEEKLLDYVSCCVNNQDKLILMLLFEGVHGTGLSELLNLKKNDVIWDSRTLLLNCDEHPPRKITVSNETIKILKEALEEKFYYCKNGDPNSKIKKKSFYIDDYVIRTTRKKNKNRIGHLFINSRFNDFKEWFNDHELTPTSVHLSGMINYAIELCKEKGKYIQDLSHSDEKNEWKKVAEKFPLKSRMVGNYKQYNSLFRLMDYDSIHEIYGNYLERFVLIGETDIDKVKVKIKKRESASKFKKIIFEAYGGSCAISGEKTSHVLEACHIQNYVNNHSNHPQNGILLRVDLHRLFDRNLLTINEDYTISVSDKLTDYYRKFNNIKITLPNNTTWHPSKEALNYRKTEYFK